MDVCIKFGDSRSNGFRNIRGADFVSNEQDEAYPNSAKRLNDKAAEPDDITADALVDIDTSVEMLSRSS